MKIFNVTVVCYDFLKKLWLQLGGRTCLQSRTLRTFEYLWARLL